MKTKTLFCCVAAITLALVSCKKDPTPDPEELTITADKTQEYAGGYINVKTNNPIKLFEFKDNLENSDFKLSVEKVSDHELIVVPGSGYMRYSGGAADMDSKITLTVTDEYDQVKDIILDGKSWKLETRAHDLYGSSLSYADLKVGDKVFLAVKSADGKDLTRTPGFSLSFEGNAYKILNSEPNPYYECEVLAGAESYEVTAAYRSRIIKESPKSVSK